MATPKVDVSEYREESSETSVTIGSNFKTADIQDGGYLFKRARNSGLNWRKRYFVLDEKKGILKYYSTHNTFEKDGDPLGSVQLGDSCSIISVGMRENCLEINTGKPNDKPLYVQCSDPRMLLLWKLRFHSYIHPLKLGFLEKRARKSGRNWRTRYFVLDLATGLLRVFENDKMDHIPTIECLGPKFEAQRSGLRENCIEVRCKDGSSPSLFLVAKSTKEHLEWLTCLRDVCRPVEDLTPKNEVAHRTSLQTPPCASPKSDGDLKANSVITSKNVCRVEDGMMESYNAKANGTIPQNSISTFQSHNQTTSTLPRHKRNTTDTSLNYNLDEEPSPSVWSVTESTTHTEPNAGFTIQLAPDKERKIIGRHRRQSTTTLSVNKEVIVLTRGKIKGLATIVRVIPEKAVFEVRMHDKEKLVQVKAEDLFLHRAVDFEFTLGKRLGKGAFATVYSGMNHSNGALIAIKKMKLKFGEQNREVLDAIMDEVRLLKELDHTNIVRFLGTEFSLADRSMFILMEQVSGGSLESALRSFGRFSESVIFSYTQHILKGLVYLHSKRVIHRDLKCANVLLSTAGVVKLADFGVSKKIKDINENDSKETESCVGSPYWMAPEVVLYQGYDTSCDVWSLGCTIVEMTTAYHPWKEYDNPLSCAYAIGQSDKLPSYPNDLSSDLEDLILKCLNRDKTKRPRCSELMLHEGFRKQRENSVNRLGVSIRGGHNFRRSASARRATTGQAGSPQRIISLGATPERNKRSSMA
eukprot:CAMPEP_0184505088 /NCGR_PEP_ID=MMETSP0113_2-20130426/52804_1 /TAXON_ID=91329 /ORGANISM="Norrisiella sphaerica, Strain BC52" /LENGTH=752 /DNA_ID=CAMNT_0026894759 /DNA_START=280 /DNA_END=2538 /DNA_ORIENTATION=+